MDEEEFTFDPLEAAKSMNEEVDETLLQVGAEYNAQLTMADGQLVTDLRKVHKHLLEAKKKQEYNSEVKVTKRTTIVNATRNVGRNELCPCGSGKKFKKCCIKVARELRLVHKRRVEVLDPKVAKALQKARKEGKQVGMKIE